MIVVATMIVVVMMTMMIDDDDDDAMYECVCPNCGDTIMLGENIIADGSIDCPNCGESLEFDFSEIEDEDNED